jgi:hypothetical protein
MNSDIYYIKYIKYKAKYINEKKIGGGCDDVSIKNVLEKLNLHQKITDNFNLLHNDKDLKEKIEKTIIDIFKQNVFDLKKLDKKCLKVPLIENLDKYYKKMDEFIIYKFGSGEYTSLNINININTNTNKIPKQEFSRGTAFIFQKPSYKERDNIRFLTNIINIKYKTDDGKIIESLRFGTPYTPTNIDFYKTQISLLKDFVGNKRCLFISLLDVCDSKLCSFGGEKKNENDIIHEEINGYSEENIVYLNIACNNSVNLKTSLSKVSDTKLSTQMSNYFNKLEEWINSSNNDILKKLKETDNFFNKFKKNVLDNDSSDVDLIKELSIQKFVLKKQINDKTHIDNLDNFLDDDNIENYIPCQENLTNENIRLVMLCYISLIFYILSIETKNEYILLYHCKSGQDRTGTFYAINQMINEITNKNYEAIKTDINNKLSFIKIFKKYYSLISESTQTTISTTNKDCLKNKELKEKVKSNNITNINSNVELCYLKYLFYSYNLTLTSTGCPGIKWSLGNTELPIKLFDKRKYFDQLEAPVDNRFPYLLLSNPYLVMLFEGASSMRGS